MSNNRVNEIDLLRFLAALAVVFFHYAFRGYAADNLSLMPYPPLASVSKYGYLGVELFFMISGFVILMTANGASLRIFVISRLVRLYPAFWACCTLTFLATLLIGAPRYSASIGQYLINMSMLSGFVGVPSIDGAYWSLFVEMRFYVLVAAILLIGKIHKAQLLIGLWLAASIAIEIFHLEKLRNFLIVDYSAYFIAGAACFLVWSQGISAARIGLIFTSWLLAIYQSLSALPVFEKHYHVEMNPYIVAAIISVIFAVLLLVSLRRTGAFGQRRWILAGALTYPFYLLHHNIGFMIFNIGYLRVNTHLLFWGTFIAMLACAFLVNRVVEKRFSLPIKNFINRIADMLTRRITRQTSGSN